MAEASGKKAVLFFISAAIFGFVAAISAYLYLSNREALLRASLTGGEDLNVSVIVAKQELPKGTQITEGLFALREIPDKYVHPNAVTYEMFDQYLGRYLSQPLAAGKPLLPSFVELLSVDFSDLVESGRRAITVQVDEITSISGMIRPGNNIDLYVNIGTRAANYTDESESETPEIITDLDPSSLQELSPEQLGDIAGEFLDIGPTNPKPTDVVLPILQGVKVLATGREAYQQYLDRLNQPQTRLDRNFSTITIDVSPEEAALLAVASDKGTLIATLRNRKDTEGVEFDGVTPFDLVKQAKKLKQQTLARKKEARLREAAEKAGATIDENGNWVTASGEVIKAEDINISSNGTITTSDGQLLAANGLTVDENGNFVDENGNIVSQEQIQTLANVAISEANEETDDLEESIRQQLESQLNNYVRLIIGGSSEDGVAKTSLMPVQSVKAE
jgi:pilus assembly protein CpaB